MTRLLSTILFLAVMTLLNGCREAYGPAQSYCSSGDAAQCQMYMDGNFKAESGDILYFPNGVRGNNANKTDCGGSQCQVVQQAVSRPTINGFPNCQSDNNVNVDSGKSKDISGNVFGRLQINSNANATLIPTLCEPVYIRELMVDSNSVVTLQSNRTYYIETLVINNHTSQLKFNALTKTGDNISIGDVGPAMAYLKNSTTINGKFPYNATENNKARVLLGSLSDININGQGEIWGGVTTEKNMNVGGLFRGPILVGGSLNINGGVNAVGWRNIISMYNNWSSTDQCQTIKTICSPNTPTVAYFKITVPAYSLTCSPAQIVIEAMDSSNNRVTNFSGTINLTTSSSRGDWAKQSAQGSLNNGVADDGAASYQFTTADQGVATLNLDHIVAGSVNITVTSGNIQSSAGPIQFVAEGYQLDFGQKTSDIFTPSEPQIANRPFFMRLQAIRQDPPRPICSPVPGYSGNKSVRLWMGYSDPSPASGVALTLNGSNVPVGEQSGKGEITINFNNGVGYSGSFNYRDAGKLSLNVRELGTPASYPVIGNAVLPVVPLGLRVLDVVRQDNTPNPRTVAAGVEEPKVGFIAAGETFKVQMAAVMDNCDVTANQGQIGSSSPNYSCVTPSYKHQLLASRSLHSPLGTGAVAGIFTMGGKSQAINDITPLQFDSPFSSGRALLDASYGEVGSIGLTFSSNNYLGYSRSMTVNEPVVGRFYPAYYHFESVGWQQRCTKFSYLSQPANQLTVLSLSARNKSGAIVANYDSAKGYLLAPSWPTRWGAWQGQTNLSSRLTWVAPLGNWNNGVFTLPSLPNESNLFAIDRLPAGQVDGPFTSVRMAMDWIGADQETFPASEKNVIPTGFVSPMVDLGISGNFMYGRLGVSSGRAAVDSALALPLTLESYTGSGWQRNADDGCTQLDLQASDGIRDGFYFYDRDYDRSKAELTLQDNGKSRLALTQDKSTPATQPTASTAKEGYIWLHFTAPLVSDRVHYRLDLARQPAAPIWLNYDWDNSGAADVDDMSGWAFFNQWRSSDRVIYRREVLN